MTGISEPPMAGDPRYDGFRIGALHAWTVVDPRDDQEGVIGVPGPDGSTIPAVASDRVRLEAFRPLAAQVADALGVPVRLRRFIPDPQATGDDGTVESVAPGVGS